MNDTQSLDKQFRQWLERLSNDWDLPIEQVAQHLAYDEIENREEVYPEILSSLSTEPIDLPRFAEAARKSWVLGHRFDATRFGEFVQNEVKAIETLHILVREFPNDDGGAAVRVNKFVDKAVEIGYRTPRNRPDRAGAASFASLVLTVIYPNRFVDFRKSRWKRFTEILDEESPPKGDDYGELLLWAGNFGRAIANTLTFRRYWSKYEAMWAIAGICWVAGSPQKPPGDPPDIDYHSFPEGATKRRLHLLRERNQSLIKKAKDLRMTHDRLLKCKVCGFSFVETYGRIGEGFIEAHHKQPVTELKSGSRTRVEDIVLVCANCHRMLHRGDHTLSINELQELMDRVNER